MFDLRVDLIHLLRSESVILEMYESSFKVVGPMKPHLTAS
jgi:hypothetical protein